MKIVILERDGVISEDSDGSVRNPAEWIPIPGSLEAIATLNQSGYRVVVTCTKPGLMHGELDIEGITAIHRKMHDELEGVGGHLDGTFFCPHPPSVECGCTNSETGLLNEISDRFGITLNGIPVVCHSRDVIESALSLKASPLRVTNDVGRNRLDTFSGGREVPRFADLKTAVEAILESIS